ncbi:MAG: thioredoxin family protein [Rhodothermales bacterium]|nr:thioredoxin family protein [Rhodothermales bacterium]
MTLRTALLIGVLLAVGCARAQEAPPVVELGSAPLLRDALPADTAWTDTEQQVQALLEEGGTVVVHFWAPWCHNSRNEYAGGFWPGVIAAHDDVRFVFVTVFNDGRLSSDVLDDAGIPSDVVRLAQPDYGPSNKRRNRRQTFLGLPLTWTPTTWIFNRRGRLAYAVNYGEVDAALMQTLLAKVGTDWSH